MTDYREEKRMNSNLMSAICAGVIMLFALAIYIYVKRRGLEDYSAVGRAIFFCNAVAGVGASGIVCGYSLKKYFDDRKRGLY